MKRLAGLSAAVFLSCRPASTRVDTEAVTAAADTVRGTLILEGTAQSTIPVLQTTSGRIAIVGLDDRVYRLSHLDLWMSGTRISPSRFQAKDFRVRSVRGAKAWNGVLRATATGFRLELDDGGSREIRGAPSRFSQLTGSHIWITETADGSVLSYGVI